MSMKKVFFYSCIVGIILFTCLLFTRKNEKKVAYDGIISPLAESMQDMGFLQKKPSLVEQKIAEVLAKREGEYAVFYKDLVTGEQYELKGDEQFSSASLYKLWILGEVFRQVDSGKIKKEDVLRSSVPELNKTFGIASESAERSEGDIELTIEDAIEKMIIVSDNYAALLLSSKVRLSNVTDFLKTYGLTHSSIGSPPKTTAHDIGILFEKLYKGEIVASLYSKEMLAILQRQRINDRLPKYIPDGILIAHKTGELDEFKHDGGIIYAIKGPYVLVVLSKSEDPTYAAETIALISKEIFNIRK